MAEPLAVIAAPVPLLAPSRGVHRRGWRPNANAVQARMGIRALGHEAAPVVLPPPQLLTSVFTPYNSITILEVPKEPAGDFSGARLLLLDETGNVHSVYREHTKWTGSYWDVFATLPAIIPDGPIAMLGLGGGTAARLMLDLWPERMLEGWEIDEVLIDKARMYLGLADIEETNEQGGGLRVHIGDAFSNEHDPGGGFAGIVVDLFTDGQVVPALKRAKTWFKLKKRLKQGGRIMINCVEDGDDEDEQPVLRAMLRAFPSEVNWRRLDSATNKMALTGSLPVPEVWAQALHEKLKLGVHEWQAFE